MTKHEPQTKPNNKTHKTQSPTKTPSTSPIRRKNTTDDSARQRQQLAEFKFRPRVNDKPYRPVSDFRSEQDTSDVAETPAPLTVDTLQRHNEEYKDSPLPDDMKSQTIVFAEQESTTHTNPPKTGSVRSEKTGRQSTVKPEKVKPENVKPENVKPESVKPESVKPESVKPESVKPESVTQKSVMNETTEPKHSAPNTNIQQSDSKSSSAQRSRLSVRTPGFSSVKSVGQNSAARESVQTWAEEPLETRGASRNDDVEVLSIHSSTGAIENQNTPINTPKSESKSPIKVDTAEPKQNSPRKRSTPNPSPPRQKPEEKGPLKSPASKTETPRPSHQKTQNARSYKEPQKPVVQNTIKPNVIKPPPSKVPRDVPQKQKPKTEQPKTVKKPQQKNTSSHQVSKEIHNNKMVFKVKASNTKNIQKTLSPEPTPRPTQPSNSNKPKKVVSSKAKPTPKPIKKKPIQPIREESRLDLDSLSDDDSVDIFELARQRYGIVLDSDSESNFG